MKTIIINEKTEKKLFEMLMNEGFGYSSKVAIIKKYLDTHFVKADMEQLNKEGDMEKKPLVIMLDSKMQPTENRLTLEQLYMKHVAQANYNTSAPAAISEFEKKKKKA